MTCPYDHDACDGKPLTCLVRESEALGLYDDPPTPLIERGSFYDLPRGPWEPSDNSRSSADG